MRILTVGNMYPPHHQGGYELIWQSAVEHLERAGHEVRVLTTDYRLPEPVGPAVGRDVRRDLRWYWREGEYPRLGARERLAVERHNGRVLEESLSEVRPHVVGWWSMGGMSLSLIERVRRRGIPSVGVVGDAWMAYGPAVDRWMCAFGPGGRLRRVARPAERLTGMPTRVSLDGPHWIFISDFVRRGAEGWSLRDTEVAHPGVDADLFRPADPEPWRWRLAYIGRMDPRKGIDVAIEALTHLPDEAVLHVDGMHDESHVAELRALAQRLEVDDRVTFRRTPRSELAEVYAAADAVLFPVRWEEPWGLVPLEAMAVGRPVVTSGRGGQSEYLRDGENCLVADVSGRGFAEAVQTLADDPKLRSRLRAGGLETAAGLTQAAFDQSVEDALLRAAGAAR